MAGLAGHRRTLMLPTAEPQEIGYCPHKLQQACDLLETWTRQDQLPAAGLAVGRHGRLAVSKTDPGSGYPRGCWF